MATVQVEMWRSFIGFQQLGCYHWIMNTGIVTIPAAISHTYWLANVMIIIILLYIICITHRSFSSCVLNVLKARSSM